ncbi:MAG: hypothetical protein KF678_12370 [Phycisphaeraceae bacterium]|nr:hypothetical protein [Phycisphaeraceae bacterium]
MTRSVRGPTPSRRGHRPRERKGIPVEAFERLKSLIASAEEDVHKAEGGNKAAGTRARQLMQDIKNAAQEVREAILAAREQPPKNP